MKNRARTLLALRTLTFSATAAQAAEPSPSDTVGETTRAAVEAKHERWKQALADTKPDATVAKKLVAAGKGAEVVVYLGTWCGDSRREVSRLWKALELGGGKPAFSIKYVALDRDMSAPGVTVPSELKYVPTFYVTKNGKELGRIVESAPMGIETALLGLLEGTSKGVITGRETL